jgi:hypothetical protein
MEKGRKQVMGVFLVSAEKTADDYKDDDHDHKDESELDSWTDTRA